jgi:hypothetical protein
MKESPELSIGPLPSNPLLSGWTQFLYLVPIVTLSEIPAGPLHQHPKQFLPIMTSELHGDLREYCEALFDYFQPLLDSFNPANKLVHQFLGWFPLQDPAYC